MTTRLRALRDLFGIVAPTSWLSFGLLPMWWLWDRLPEPMAAHWSADGSPDGALPRAVHLALLALLIGLPALITFRVTRRAPAPRWQIAPSLALASFLGVLGAIDGCVVVWLNLDAPSWQEAGPLPWSWLALATAVAAAVAAVTARLAAHLETEALPDRARLPSVGLGATERAVWTAAATNPWSAGAAIGLIGAGLAALLVAPRLPASIAVVAGCALVAVAIVRVRVDERGMTVAYGPFGFPRQRVPIAHIRRASVVDVVPLRHGGWGYRGSLLLFRRASIVVRRGAGIQLDCERGQLIVTVDDAEAGAGLVNDLVARAGG